MSTTTATPASSIPAGPPAAVIIGGLLRLVVQGREPITAASPWGPGQTHLIELRSLWMLSIESDDNSNPWRLLAAIPPDVRRQPWRWGCQMDDWTLGPDAQPVNPLDQLNADQRTRLRQRLEQAPAPRPLVEWWDVNPLPPDFFLD